MIAHWNGTAWSTMPQGSSFYGIWGSSTKSVWAVGVNNIAGNDGGMRQWNGTAWNWINPGVAPPLYAIWGSAANDIWAVGQGGTIVHYQ